MSPHHQDSDIAVRTPPDLGDIPMQQIQRDPLGFLKEVTGRHPDIACYSTNGWQVVLVNHPEGVRHVLKSNWHNYTKNGTPDLMMLRPMLGSGLMTVDGDEWSHQRRYLQPAFHNEVIDGYVPEMAAQTEKVLDVWARETVDNGTLDLAPRFSHLTLAIVAKTLFGLELTGQAEKFGRAVDTLNAIMSHFDPWDSSAMVEFQQAQNVIGRVVKEIADTTTTDNASNLLSALRGASDHEGKCPLASGQIRDQIFTFLMAGHETTAKALTWALYLLARHPQEQQRCREEALAVLGDHAPDPTRLDALEYTWQVLQEAMRLYPSVWSMSRKALADDEVLGYHIPADSLVIVSPYTLHRRVDLWPDPERFDPDRFTADAVIARDSFSYIPFSQGSRTCIGRPFAISETKLVLAMLLRRFEVTLAVDGEIEPEALVTLRPRQGLPVRLTPIASRGN